MSDDEVIRFEITDYDLDNEFNTGRGRRPNKEQQIYGVWAKDSDEDDNEDNVRKKLRKPKDYSAPVGFVAGGVQQAGKKKEQKKEIAASVDGEMTQVRAATDSSSESDRVDTPEPRDTAGVRRRGQGLRAPNLGGSVGVWERHTKGIGAKLLLQMGYQPGKGLGKDLQGISAPVEATLRKGRGAVGAYGPEKATQKAKKEEEKRLKDKEGGEEEKVGGQKSYHWKKSHKGRYFYRDAADVIQEGKPTTHPVLSSLSQVPVIDMTGRQKRVLSGYGALRSVAPRFEDEPRRQCRNFSAPELSHNLRVMLECCERDIIDNARALHTAQDEARAMEAARREVEGRLEGHAAALTAVRDVLAGLRPLLEPHMSLDIAHRALRELQESHPLEYEMFGVGRAAASDIGPLLSSALATWTPLTEPERGPATMAPWRSVLGEEPYLALVWRIAAPVLDAAVAAWDPRRPEPMLRAYAAWEEADAWPQWAGERAARAAAAKLAEEAARWDPTRDTQPLHEWVLPWHARCGPALAEAVYPGLRSRLATALSAWHPADPSALPLLAAWRTAWGGALTALLHRHVVPRLEACLRAATATPEAPEAWQWCVPWLDLLGAPTLAALAERALLPRWLAALAAWLNTNPPHAEVLTSYTNFKKAFPEEVVREPGVRDALRKALDMLNRSADASPLPQPPLRAPPSPPPAPSLGPAPAAASFTELVETRLSRAGVALVPAPGRTREGRPLYRCGARLLCYTVRNLIMCSQDAGRTFRPVSLDELVRAAQD